MGGGTPSRYRPAGGGWGVRQLSRACRGLDPEPAHTADTPGTRAGRYRLLCGLSALGTVAPYLAGWNLAEPSAARHLRDLVAGNAATIIAKGRLANPYWAPDAGAEAIAWLRSPQLSDAVTAAIVTTTDPGTLDEIDHYLAAMR